MTILGIDPGATGAIALLPDGDPAGLLILDMPSVKVKRGGSQVREVSPGMLYGNLGLELCGDHPVYAYLERVHALPGQGVSSMFSFGRALGIVEGVLAALLAEVTQVSPAEWTRAMRVRGGKDGARARAVELFPGRAHLFARVEDHGRADAALIAYYGAKQRRIL